MIGGAVQGYFHVNVGGVAIAMFQAVIQAVIVLISAAMASSLQFARRAEVPTAG